MLDKSLSLSFPFPDIALVRVEALHAGAEIPAGNVVGELDALLDQLATKPGLSGLVIASGKLGPCSSGAGLRAVASRIDSSAEEVLAQSQEGQRVFSRLASCPFVTVAAIDGACLGTLAQLACWCDSRVFSDSSGATIGFPDVTLGLVPQWGGTVRVPRLIGLAEAVELLIFGRTIDAVGAQKIGLADALVPQEKLVEAAVDWVRGQCHEQNYLARRAKHQRPMDIGDAELETIAETARRAMHRAEADHLPAVALLLELLLDTVRCNSEEACRRESVAVSRLFGTPVHRALLNAALLRNRNTYDAGTTEPMVRVDSIGIIGAGLMGTGIAAANLDIRTPVVITDASSKALGNAATEIFQQTIQDGSNSPASLTIAEHEEDVVQCGLIIETVVEALDVKRRIYERLEPKLDPDTILVSNTSTLPITRLAERMERPERFCGLHFFNPIRQMELVEVIRGPRTSDTTIATVAAYAKRLGKMPIVVNDGPGFLVNRLLSAYLNEAQELVCAGVPIQAIDDAAESFGMRLGPMKFYDMVGLDTAFYAGMSMYEAFRDRLGLLPIIPKMFKTGRLGQKVGLGFYRYETPDGPAIPDPSVYELIDPYVRNRIEIGPDEIRDRIFLAVLLEATRVLEAGIVHDARDIDTGIVYGLGFPRFRGGILYWGDTLGANRILEMVEPLKSLGARFHSPALLSEMARGGSKFYDAPC